MRPFIFPWRRYLRSLLTAPLCLLLSSALGAGLPGSAEDPVNDQAIHRSILREGIALIESDAVRELSELASRLSPNALALRLHPVPETPLPAPSVIEQCLPGVAIVARIYKCPRCTQWHSSFASGFFITPDGALVTSRHVVDPVENGYLMIRTHDGKMAAVQRILALDPEADLAILGVAGEGYTALPVAKSAQVGATIHVISHPNSDFYTVTKGCVSRYVRQRSGNRTTTLMAITADFAKGSSGAPVLNEAGAVVGVVQQTTSVYYNSDATPPRNLQMVIRQCVPSQYIWNLSTGITKPDVSLRDRRDTEIEQPEAEEQPKPAVWESLWTALVRAARWILEWTMQ